MIRILKIYISKIFKTEVSRNTSVLVSGTLLAQLIPFILQPFLRRYFDPEVFGAYSVYMSLLGILIIIASGKYELAIVLPKSDKNAINLVALNFILNGIFNILLLFPLLFWNTEILLFLNLSDKYKLYLYMVPAGTFLYNGYQSVNYWLIRRKAFKPISINKFIRRGFEGAAQVGFAVAKQSNGLIFGDILGNFINLIVFLKQGVKTGLNFKWVSLIQIKYVLRKYSEFPKYNLFPGFLSACSYLLPAILINKFYGQKFTGYFDLSKMMLSIPLALIASSVSSVLLQKVSEKFKANQSLLSDLKPVLYITLIVAFMEWILIYFWGESIFVIIFGKSWQLAGTISQIMVWSFVLNFIVASFNTLFIGLNKIKLYSLWQIFYFFTIIMLVFFKNSDFVEFLSIYVAVEIINYFLVIILGIYIVYKYETNLKAGANYK